MNTEVNENQVNEEEEKEEGEWEGDGRNWVSEEEESEDSEEEAAGVEEDEKSMAGENSNREDNIKESFIAESTVAAHAHNGRMEKDPNEYDPSNNGSGDNLEAHGVMGKTITEPNLVIGQKGPTNTNLEKEAQPKRSREEDNVSDPDRYDAPTLKKGEVSDKLKKLLSRNVPIEEKLVMVGSDLTETQRKIRVKKGSVNTWNSGNNMEKRITRSQAKKKRREDETNNKKDISDTEIGSESSMSVGIFQRLEEVGRLSGLRKGGNGGKPCSSIVKEGGTEGKL
ncbi:hypothetical protein L1887_13619 [Cichorium endivia]|nr:hypothetical protein L1887_13619 [Cichorium endivia]